MIEVYLMVPLLYAGTKMKEGKGLYYLLVLFGLFGILKSTLTVFVYPNPSIQVLLKTKLPNLAFYSGYFLLGYFLEHRWKKKIPSRWLLLTLLGTIAVFTLLGQMDAIQKGQPAGIFYGYFCLPVCLEAVCLFLLFKNIGAERLRGKWSGTIAFVSKATMGIYLLHPFVLERLDRAGINSLTWNTWYAVPLVTLLTFAICLGISAVLLKLPLVKKML